MNSLPKKGKGWLRDLPDMRDYTPQHKAIKPLLDKTQPPKKKSKALPITVDLRPWFSPVEDQGGIGSCTAQAGVALIEYFQKRAFGKHIDASKLFLYKVTRRLLHFQGDTGAYLRTTMGAIALFGVPPEEYWPYTDNTTDNGNNAYYDAEPPAFCYAFAQNYQAIKYYRLDTPDIPRDKLVTTLKANLAAGIPSMFGFTCYDSIATAWENGGKIPFPDPNESVTGGHAVVTAGYDDEIEITNPNNPGITTKGAFLIKNSWGEQWGDAGYGWLPYDYVTQWLATDWWSLIKSEWIDTGNFTW
jgi:C1A family cysteine protease